MSTIRYVAAAVVFWVVVLALAASPSYARLPGGSGTTYYVSPTGSDAAAGTSPATAWQTVSHVNGFSFNCGDVVLFQGGQTFIGPVKIWSTGLGGTWAAPCSPATPFTIGSYGQGSATIHGAGNTDAGVDIQNFGGIVGHDLTLTGSGAASTAAGLSIQNGLTTKLDVFYFTNIDASSFQTGCLVFSNADTAATSYLLTNFSLINSKCHDNIWQGIHLDTLQSGSIALKTRALFNIFISGSQFYNNAGSSGTCGHGVNIVTAESLYVLNSVMHDNGTGATGCTGLVAYEDKSYLIRGNEAYSNHTNGSVDGDGLDCHDGGSVEGICEYNYAHDNDGACIVAFQPAGEPLWNNNIIRYNICQNNGVKNSFGEQFIGTAGTMGALFVYGNTYYNNVSSNPIVQTLSNGTTGLSGVFANNILLQGNASNRMIDLSANNPTNWIIQGNDYSGSTLFRQNNTAYATVALWRAGVSTETYRGADTSLSASPSLTNAGGGGTIWPAALSTLTAYELQAGSAMLNAGQNLAVIFGVNAGGFDFYGNRVPAPSNGNYDVGANQRTQ